MRLSYRALLLACLSLIACFPLTASDTLEWTGCGISRNAYMGAVAKAYEEKTGVKVHLSGGGATKGIRSVAVGSADVGGSCRHLLKNTEGKTVHEETGVELIQVGWDALVAVVHKDNQVSTVSLSQIQQILRGKITNWKELGGIDQKILVVMREGRMSGVGLLLRQLILDDEHYEPQFRHIVVKSSGPLEEHVSKLKGSIAIDGISSAKKVSGIKALAIDGVLPTKENIMSGKYGLFRPLYLSVSKDYRTHSKVAEFVAFILSEEGQRVIAEEGTVNLKEGRNLAELWKRSCQSSEQ